jgi:ketosteroid isomerase-like protein
MTVIVVGSARSQSSHAKGSAKIVLALIERLHQSQAAYDQNALESILAEDYVEISPKGALDERSKVLGFYNGEARERDGNPSVTFKTSDVSVRLYGKFAIVVEHLEFRTRLDGRAADVSAHMRATLVCRRDKQGWKVASAQYTGIKNV